MEHLTKMSNKNRASVFPLVVPSNTKTSMHLTHLLTLRMHFCQEKKLVEHRTGIAEVMGSNPVRASDLFLAFLCNCLSCFTTAKITFTCMLPHFEKSRQSSSTEIHEIPKHKLSPSLRTNCWLLWPCSVVPPARQAGSICVIYRLLESD